MLVVQKQLAEAILIAGLQLLHWSSLFCWALPRHTGAHNKSPCVASYAGPRKRPGIVARQAVHSGPMRKTLTMTFNDTADPTASYGSEQWMTIMKSLQVGCLHFKSSSMVTSA